MKKLIPECPECGRHKFQYCLPVNGTIEITNPVRNWTHQRVDHEFIDSEIELIGERFTCAECWTHLEDPEMCKLLDWMIENHYRGVEVISRGRRKGEKFRGTTRSEQARAWSLTPIHKWDLIEEQKDTENRNDL